jgi:hypothetical protein
LEWISGKLGGKLWLDSSGIVYGPVVASCGHGNDPSGSILGGEFVD